MFKDKEEKEMYMRNLWEFYHDENGNYIDPIQSKIELARDHIKKAYPKKMADKMIKELDEQEKSKLFSEPTELIETDTNSVINEDKIKGPKWW